jgi:hypothetical protein
LQSIFFLEWLNRISEDALKKRRIAAMVCAVASLGISHTAFAYSYAEVMAGFAFSTGLEVHQSADADRVTPGSISTTIAMQGLFPLLGRFSFSPSFSYLSTNGDVRGDPLPPVDYQVRFQQSELALDLLWQPGGLRKFRIGPGLSAAWWTAVEDLDLPPTYYHDDELDYRTRVIRGQSALIRGVIHLMLRNPEVTGVSAKLIVGMPVTEFLKWEDSAATGYVALNIGFSMILN